MKPAARFRHNVSITLAGFVALLGAVPVATSGFGAGGEPTPWWAYPLALILVIPILVMVWGWRTGTDVNSDGLAVRALFGSRRVAWTQVKALVPQGRKVVAVLSNDSSIELPAVSKSDLPRLISASGAASTSETERETENDTETESDTSETDASEIANGGANA